jgi:putative transposase
MRTPYTDIDNRVWADILRYMSWYRRWREGGVAYFFTVVTFGRRPVFTAATARQCLREALQATQVERPFEILGIVLLPEHVHCLWQMPFGDSDFSTRWRLIKARFSRSMLASDEKEGPRNQSRQKRHERAFWQRRFWEHLIRDETDMKRHLDYIHYNPVKHRRATAPKDWPYSTFGKYLALGEYPKDWGYTEPDHLVGWTVEGEP